MRDALPPITTPPAPRWRTRLTGNRLWPGIWLGAAVVNYTVNESVFAALMIATGNTLEALAGGIRAAFLCGAICALLAVAFAFLVRKPDAPGMSGAH